MIGFFKVQARYETRKAPDDSAPSLYEPFGGSECLNYKIDAGTLNRIRNNAYSKRDEDHYFVVVGHPSDSALLTHAIKLTEKGFPFRPNDMGKKLYGNVCYPRGIKWIYEASRIQDLMNSCYLSI